MKTLSAKQRQKILDALAAMPDDQIDTSDIPEITEEQFRRAVRGRWYRPIKKAVTIRLDADVVDWLKQDGPGYQTKTNALLRREMLRDYKKKPHRASTSMTKKNGRKRVR